MANREPLRRSDRRLARRVAALVGCLSVAVAACSGGGDATPTSSTQATVPIGQLPSTLVGTTLPEKGDATHRTTTTFAPSSLVGARVDGNRILVLGDSVTASTSKRYSNDMCEALVPLGWQVEVEAESGRRSDFGLRVMKDLMPRGWDAAVILLGNNYGDDADAYQSEMQEMVTLMAPRPVVLLTVSEFARSRVTVNRMILDIASRNTNVLVVDWAAITAANRSLTGGDRLHLTLPGRTALAESVASALGRAPGSPGACLDSKYTDDSMGPVQGTTTVPRPTTSATPAPDTEVPGT
jgi:lysophospholipase L1-like esterase